LRNENALVGAQTLTKATRLRIKLVTTRFIKGIYSMPNFPINISVGVALVAASVFSFSVDSINDKYGWLYLLAALGVTGLRMFFNSQNDG
jgi:hypothetical protein